MRTLLAVLATVAISGCANGLDAPMARFGGSFDPIEGLRIVQFDALADDDEITQALLQKVPVDEVAGNFNDPTPGTVDIRQSTDNVVGGGIGRPLRTNLSGAGALGGTCGNTDVAAFTFRVVLFNATGADFAGSPASVVRIDSVNTGDVRFCHQTGRANISTAEGLQRGLLASYNYGTVLDSSTSQDQDGASGQPQVGRRIVTTFVSGTIGAFNFTGSVFGNF